MVAGERGVGSCLSGMELQLGKMRQSEMDGGVACNSVNTLNVPEL